jgi:hypothetical protein
VKGDFKMRNLVVGLCLVLYVLLFPLTVLGQGPEQTGGTLTSFPGWVRHSNPAAGDWWPDWVLDGGTLTTYKIDSDMVCEDLQLVNQHLLIIDNGLHDSATDDFILIQSDYQPTQVFGWIDETQILLAMAVDNQHGPGPMTSRGRVADTYVCEELFVLDSVTSMVEQITDFAGELDCVSMTNSALSPDATTLVFTMALPTTHTTSLVHTFNIADREDRIYDFPMENAGHYPLNSWVETGFHWSPDSRYLAFSHDGNLTVLDTFTDEYYFTYEATKIGSDDPPSMPAGVDIVGWCTLEQVDVTQRQGDEPE